MLQFHAILKQAVRNTSLPCSITFCRAQTSARNMFHQKSAPSRSDKRHVCVIACINVSYRPCCYSSQRQVVSSSPAHAWTRFQNIDLYIQPMPRLSGLGIRILSTSYTPKQMPPALVQSSLFPPSLPPAFNERRIWVKMSEIGRVMEIRRQSTASI